MLARRGLFPVLFGGRGASITCLFRDVFLTPDDAPLTSPRTAEPGPGSWTVTQTDNNFSIAGGELLMAAGSTKEAKIESVAALARTAGLCLMADAMYQAAYLTFGLTDYAVGINTGGAWTLLGGGSSGGALTGSAGASTYYPVAIILRSTGAYILVKISGTWVLAWVSATGTATEKILMLQTVNYTGAAKTKNVRAAVLGGVWTTDYGYATDRTASASAGATTTSEANAIIEATWTAVTGETYEMDVRRTDADNRWIVRCDQGGGTIKLIQREGGVETERSSASQTWTNSTAYRIIATLNGSTIKSHVNTTLRNSYASATFNVTATGAKTSHAVTDLITWPLNPSGAALAALEAM